MIQGSGKTIRCYGNKLKAACDEVARKAVASMQSKAPQDEKSKQALEAYIKVLEGHASFDRLKPALVDVYYETFDIKEVRELTPFFLSATGKKFLEGEISSSSKQRKNTMTSQRYCPAK